MFIVTFSLEKFNHKLFLLLLLCLVTEVNAQQQMLDSSMYYIRNGDKPEWQEFSSRIPFKEFNLDFNATENLSEQTLQLRQYDVKQSWQVFLNGNKLGSLVTDMNDMIIYLPVPPKAIHSGMNKLRIIPASTVADDIVVGLMVTK